MILQLLYLPLQKYSLITGFLALASSNIMSFFKLSGSFLGGGNSFISLVNTTSYTLNLHLDHLWDQ